MNGCVFCQVARGEIRSAIIYEDAEVIGLMDICPIRPGHAQIIPREHFDYFDDLPDVIALSHHSFGAASCARPEDALRRAARGILVQRRRSRPRPCSRHPHAQEDRHHIATLHCRRDTDVSECCACALRLAGRHRRATARRAGSMNQLVRLASPAVPALVTTAGERASSSSSPPIAQPAHTASLCSSCGRISELVRCGRRAVDRRRSARACGDVDRGRDA
jgi:hypothetical protein